MVRIKHYVCLHFNIHFYRKKGHGDLPVFIDHGVWAQLQSATIKQYMTPQAGQPPPFLGQTGDREVKKDMNTGS